MRELERQKQLQKMLDLIESSFPLCDNVRNAFLQIPRDIFMPSGMTNFAYNIDAIPIGANQFISSPLSVAKMTQYLEIDKSCDNILEIGCGSGYQAAILSCLFRRVFSIERIDRLREEAIARFKQLSIMNINTKLDDGQNGWERFAPFDRILFSASLKEIPVKIINQLANNGMIVAPIINDDGTQSITRFIKSYGGLSVLDRKDSCLFVKVRDNVE